MQTSASIDRDESQVQDRVLHLARYLAEVVHLQEPLHIQLSTGLNTGAEHRIGDTGLILRIPDELAVIGGTPVETADVLLRDGAALTRSIATAVPWSELPGRLARLMKTYQVERCGRDTFATWARGLPDRALLERMGLTQSVTSPRASVSNRSS